MAERHEEEDRGRVGLASLADDRQAGGGGSRWKWEFARGKHE